MKTSAFLLALAMAGPAANAAETTGNYAVESRNNTEVFTSKITKVYQVKEGDIDYVAYVVTWRDHEVVVQPMGFRDEEKRYQVGDTLRCSLNQMLGHRKDGALVGQVTFRIWPANLPIPPVIMDPADPARMEAVAVEVERRRQLREVERQGATPPTPPPPAPAAPEPKSK